MPVREGPPEPAPPPAGKPPPYPAEKARGGKIILRTPLRRTVFIGGLVGIAVLLLLLAFLA
jgi:hypothetical protein